MSASSFLVNKSVCFIYKKKDEKQLFTVSLTKSLSETVEMRTEIQSFKLST